MLDSMKQAGLKVSPGGVIRFFARPYVAGYSAEAAFAVARQVLAERKILSTIDLLGEEATDPAAVAAAKATYLELIEQIAADPAFADLPTRPTVSLKLSGLVPCGEEDGKLKVDDGLLRENMLEVAEAAAARQVHLTIDMEDHRWTDTTLEIFRAVREAGHDHVGTVLQSRLFRTPDDIAALPAGSRIRMVIGVYLEPAEIALTDKAEMKDKLLDQCAQLLDAGAKVELATHDEQLLARFFDDVVAPRDVDPDRYEIQMLLGVPRTKVQEALVAGTFRDVGQPVDVRLYVPYALTAADGTAYCRRRLIENPQLVTYGALNLLRRS